MEDWVLVIKACSYIKGRLSKDSLFDYLPVMSLQENMSLLLSYISKSSFCVFIWIPYIQYIQYILFFHYLLIIFGLRDYFIGQYNQYIMYKILVY